MTGQTTETQWYIARDSKQHGPLTDIEMRTFVAHNYLRATDLIWRPGMTEWTLAPAVFPAVFPEGGSAPPAPEPEPVAPEPEPEPQAWQNAPEETYAPAEPYPEPDAYQPRPQQRRTRDQAGLDAPPRGGMGRRVLFSTVAIGAMGAVAYGALNYGDPLMKMLGSGTDSTVTVTEAKMAAPPTVQAQSSPSSLASANPASEQQATTPTDTLPESAAAAAATAAQETASAPTLTAPDATTVSNTTPPAATAVPETSTTPSSPAATASSNNSSTSAVTAAAPAAASTQVAALEPSAPASPMPQTAITASSVDERLQKITAWSLIKKNHPDWYRDQVAAADKLVSEQKPAADVSMQLAQGLVALRRQNADKALAASPDKLRRIAAAFLENLKALRAQSVSACYGFISKGEASPAVAQIVDTGEGETAFHNQVAAIFEAIAEGSEKPTTHQAAVKADYDLLIKELGKLGWKEEDLQTFSNPRLLAKREPERVCKMVQDWFVAHLAVADKTARDRLLYETLKPVVSG